MIQSTLAAKNTKTIYSKGRNIFYWGGGGGWAGVFENVFAKKVVALPLSGSDLCVTLHKDALKNI